jgi:small-conductance mechanosensitive channel
MLDLYKLQIIESITIVIAYVLIRLLFASLIKRSAKKFSYQKRRITLIRKATYLFISCLAFLLILLVWGVKQHELFFFMSSTITVIGVAFFAQWSLLSNTTASLIIFLNHPIKIGDKIEIIEEDDNIIGVINDIGLFFITIKTEEKEILTITNTLFLQKLVKITNQS